MGKLTKDKRVLREFTTYSKTDIYYRKAKQQGYRARSAYKLLQINQQFDIFTGSQRVIDLCAAPGSWSQVIATKLKQKGIITQQSKQVHAIAIDLQQMAPIEGVSILQGDITRQQSLKNILQLFQGNKADLIVCDGAPDVTGFHDIDQYIQAQLIVASLNITLHLLKKGGKFVAKIFRGKDVNILYDKLKCFFKHVFCAKPRSSRNSSIEAFVVCLDYSPPEDQQFTKDLLKYATGNPAKVEELRSTWEKKVVPFVACGALDGYDPDMNYPLEEGVEHKEPTQLPINPPYKMYMELKQKKLI